MSPNRLQPQFADDDKRDWPSLPPGYSHEIVPDDVWRLFRQLARSVDLTRGLLPTDLGTCMAAAQSFVEAATWRETMVALRALEVKPGDNIGDLIRASRAARQAEGAYVANCLALGLRGDLFGKGKSKAIRAAAGFGPDNSKWNGSGALLA
ncbi:hypothetical protein [Alloyangia pacifica]|uniref:Uncharacterized protein n=1 Tax=Alloyangia pacifica TaxID=311180 RepID=A0A1I6PQU0_9RHOB|nr:hypothetical protein [Alloyangia pacifica]SDG33445.1 hypothetical protein SAMN04488245_102404 [Alloyangia pacifica]SFS42554.1 hypothetical protein SAMN04488050_101705 [Alloyangia pacifica]